MSRDICVSRLSFSLDDTIEWMTSPDPIKRFKAEFYQLSIRIYNLKTFLKECEENPSDTKLLCSYNLLKAQLHAMETYIYCMQERAKQEHIEL